MQKIPKGLVLRGKRWRVQTTVYAAGQKKQLRETTGCREEDLEQAIRVFERRILEIQAELREGPKPNEHLFMEAAARYTVSLERRGKSAQTTLDALKRIMDAIGHLPLSHVHQGTIDPWINAHDGVYKSNTIKRTLGAVTAVLNHAARVLRDGSRPWLAIAVPKLQPPDWADQRPPYQLTWDEQDALVSVLPGHLVASALFNLFTGTREQEVASLTWAQECQVTGLPRGAIWWIPPEIRKRNARKAVNEQEGRYLVCNALARSVIDGQRGNGSEWVFPGPSGKRVLRLNNSGFRTARKTVGLDLHWHDLRHTFGKRAEAAGIPKEYRSVLLGHSVNDITSHYSAPGFARLLEEAEKITRTGAVILRAVHGQFHGQTKTAV